MQIKRFSHCFRIALVLLMFASLPAMLMADDTPLAPADAASPSAIAETANVDVAAALATPLQSNAKFYAIAVAVAIGSMSAAYAVGKIGAAVMGAAAEKPEIMSKALPFVALGEGIALFGFLVAIFLLGA